MGPKQHAQMVSIINSFLAFNFTWRDVVSWNTNKFHLLI